MTEQIIAEVQGDSKYPNPGRQSEAVSGRINMNLRLNRCEWRGRRRYQVVPLTNAENMGGNWEICNGFHF